MTPEEAAAKLMRISVGIARRSYHLDATRQQIADDVEALMTTELRDTLPAPLLATVHRNVRSLLTPLLTFDWETGSIIDHDGEDEDYEEPQTLADALGCCDPRLEQMLDLMSRVQDEMRSGRPVHLSPREKLLVESNPEGWRRFMVGSPLALVDLIPADLDAAEAWYLTVLDREHAAAQSLIAGVEAFLEGDRA